MKKYIFVISLLALFALTTAAFAQEADQKQGSKKATVKVVSVDASANTIEAKDTTGANVTLKISPQAKITKEGKAITLAEIKANDTLAIEYDEEGGNLTAKTVAVVAGKAKSSQP
ncbi:MAG: hypothetical protein L0226_07080 [Acidobacteria bacterium]|nr:hypothetical protein [Acidobacteriota bacterium]